MNLGVTPGHPVGPPGYGGPLSAEDLGEDQPEEPTEEHGENEFEGEDGQIIDGNLQVAPPGG